MSKPIDKKLYKGTNPSCHDFNAASATYDGAPLLIGFSTGQIQLVHPGRREQGKLYNEERLIDKTKVTCLKWIPGSKNLFLASHSSGHLYLYNEELPCTPTSPNYQSFKMGDGYTILTCKSKSTRNPLYKWQFGTLENSCINEFCFSPCGSNLAIVSQDGFLRVFHYDTMELLGVARSYFGGFLCVCWSPDGKYVVVGGEDDLVTVYSFNEKRVVARGQGHRSWVSVVAFDPFTTSYTNWDGPDFSDDENPINECHNINVKNSKNFNNNDDSNDAGTATLRSSTNSSSRPNSTTIRDSLTTNGPEKLATSYRLGSVSQDTQLCLWDITEDVLRQSMNHNNNNNNSTQHNPRQRLNSSHDSSSATINNSDHNIDIKLIKPIVSTQLNKDQVDSSSATLKNNLKNMNSNLLSGINNSENIGDNILNSMNKLNDNNSLNSNNSSNSSFNKQSKNNCISNSNLHNSNEKIGNCSKLTTAIIVGVASTTPSTTTTTTTTPTILSSTSVTTTTTISTPPSSSSSTSESTLTNNSNSSNSNHNNNNNNNHRHHSAFNTLTQRLSNFSFVNNHNNNNSSDNKTNKNHNTNKRNFTLSKTIGNHNSSIFSNHSNENTILKNGNNNKSSSSTSSSTSAITTYDPIKLIGTPACPRFDECPVLEPLVCKKIAHERLSALIFREDCFLTACQDGFVYTWARPGYMVSEHSILRSLLNFTCILILNIFFFFFHFKIKF